VVWGGCGRNGGCDCFQHASSIGHDLEIVKAKNAESFLDEKGVAASIALHMFLLKMLAAIDFDHQACGVTDKINDIWTHRDLSAKACTEHSMSAQRSPYPPLGVG